MDRNGLPFFSYLLQHTLRSLCADSDWVYSIYWTILPRNYPPPKWDNCGGHLDQINANKRNWILVWEDGFCDFVRCCRDEMLESRRKDFGEEDTFVSTLRPELFFKMSHDVYNFGEGFMGKAAAENSHKWVYRNPSAQEITPLSFWQASHDAHPRTWEAQFIAGIQTIAVVSVGGGLLQLGSTKKISEDLEFVLSLQRKFHCLRNIFGVFSSDRTSESLQAQRNSFQSADKEENGRTDEDGSWSCMSDRMIEVADVLTDGHSDARRSFQHDSKFRASDRIDRPRGDYYRSQSRTLQALSSSDRRFDELCTFEEPPLCFKKSPPILPSMSSLEALLLKLPAVTASDSPSIPSVTINSPSLEDRNSLGGYLNSSIPAFPLNKLKELHKYYRSPPDLLSQLLPQWQATPNCMKTVFGGCMQNKQGPVAMSSTRNEFDDGV